MSLTNNQRDLLLQSIDRKLSRVLHLIEPEADKTPTTRKKDPRALYGGKNG